jgi:hypothetical protein
MDILKFQKQSNFKIMESVDLEQASTFVHWVGFAESRDQKQFCEATDALQYCFESRIRSPMLMSSRQ